MSEGRNTELVSRLRALPTMPGSWVDTVRNEAADALESTSRALSEKEGELAKLSGRLSFALDEGTSWAVKAGLATRQRDEALAALKASEEREAKLIRKLASARLRPEPSKVEALRACHAFLCEQAPNNDALLDMIDAALAQEGQS